MKFLATILLTYILLLTAVPAMHLFTVNMGTQNHEDSCCSKDADSKDEESTSTPYKNCCDNGACNSFMSCCNGYALIIQSQKICSFYTYTSNQFASITEDCCSSFLADTWHPPKFA